MIPSKWSNSTLLLVLLVFIGCAAEPDFSMLCGEWKSVSDTGFFIESWECTNDGALGRAFEIQVGDTVFSESSNIKKVGGEWVLHIQASNQNGGAYIPFYLTESSANKLKFENLDYDFPKRIVYRKTEPNSLNVIVDGGDESEKILNFTFEKVTAAH